MSPIKYKIVFLSFQNKNNILLKVVFKENDSEMKMKGRSITSYKGLVLNVYL